MTRMTMTHMTIIDICVWEKSSLPNFKLRMSSEMTMQMNTQACEPSRLHRLSVM